MNVTQSTMEKALQYLAETDIQAAHAKALVEGLGEQRKTIKSIMFLSSDQKTAQAKEADAYASEEYIKHVEKLQNAVAEYETLRNKRLRAQLTIDVWRSINSNMKKGNVI